MNIRKGNYDKPIKEQVSRDFTPPPPYFLAGLTLLDTVDTVKQFRTFDYAASVIHSGFFFTFALTIKGSRRHDCSDFAKSF